MSDSVLPAEEEGFPDYVRALASVVVVRLDRDGMVQEASAGFRLIAGSRAAPEKPWQAAPLFIQPSFSHLLQQLDAAPGALLHEGMLNLGEPGTMPVCLRGSVSRRGDGLLIVAEHDVADWERLRTSVLSLNEELAQTQRQLVRDIQARKRAEREREQAYRELEDTNRGILSLYAELDDKAQALQRASEMKSRFLSNMTHELRTPLNAILSLSRLLLEDDEPLTSEQHTQVTFVRKSAEALSVLVNDLLDLARIEAGKSIVRRNDFTVADLFGALRGMLRPLLPRDASVALIFEDASTLPPLSTDEGKVAQVLRNFISNALKFTERGEVRVGARLDGADAVVFCVADTGIGVSAADRERIFEEFAQVEEPIQRRAQGTGLGLPLSRKLAELLGGRVWMESEPGVGSTFFARIPLHHDSPADEAAKACLPEGPLLD